MSLCDSGAGYRTVDLLTYCLQHKCSRKSLVSGIIIFMTTDTHFSPNFRENRPTSIISSFDLCNIARPSLLTFQVSLKIYSFQYNSFVLYTVCLKNNIPDIFSYNLRKQCRIFIIFGTLITEKVGNQ